MPTLRIPVVVLAADVAAAEAHLSAYGSYPLSVPLVPYPGPEDATATAYGANISCVWPGTLHDAIVEMPTLFTGAAVNPVQYTSPYWKAFNTAVHWTAWLNSLGLQPQVL